MAPLPALSVAPGAAIERVHFWEGFSAHASRAGLRRPEDELSPGRLSPDLTRVPTCGLSSTQCEGGWAFYTVTPGFGSSLP